MVSICLDSKYLIKIKSTTINQYLKRQERILNN